MINNRVRFCGRAQCGGSTAYFLQQPRARPSIDASDERRSTANASTNVAQMSRITYHQPRGLVNNGNLCFVNAWLQCLAALPGLLESVEQQLRIVRQEWQHSDHNQVSVAEALVNLLRCISSEDGDIIQHKMSRFLQAVSQCSDLVSRPSLSQEQQDAEELLSFLLEQLHRLLRTQMQLEHQSEEQEEFRRAEALLLNELRGSTPDDTQTYLQTVVISLAIDAEKGDQFISDCLADFRQQEELAGDTGVLCEDQCRRITTRETQILLQRVPTLLVLQLQRFKHVNEEKVDASVGFPCGADELLDITDNTFLRNEHRVKFQLVAICAHRGDSINSGHYISYVRHKLDPASRHPASSNDWVQIDDSMTSVIDESTFQNETLTTAYLLCYSQVFNHGMDKTRVNQQEEINRSVDNCSSLFGASEAEVQRQNSRAGKRRQCKVVDEQCSRLVKTTTHQVAPDSGVELQNRHGSGSAFEWAMRNFGSFHDCHWPLDSAGTVEKANLANRSIYAWMIANLEADCRLRVVDPLQQLRRLFGSDPIPNTMDAAIQQLCAYLMQERLRSVTDRVLSTYWDSSFELRAYAQYFRGTLVVIDC
ncbi:unnamed protein product [Phytophthora lilii]|uniref:Ubiquitin carboxyl-terminal hydrolase n=1 Tax=Phytophthora lilii TaxID=2077276 RepID=A0A9W6U8X9_9STRA|nr:unnamed protein product [Phytophthora lilii]